MKTTKSKRKHPPRLGYIGLYSLLIEVITGRAKFIMYSLVIYMLGIMILIFIVMKPLTPFDHGNDSLLSRLIQFNAYTISYIFGLAVIISVIQVLRSTFGLYEKKCN